jgi:hypothetical protein
VTKKGHRSATGHKVIVTNHCEFVRLLHVPKNIEFEHVWEVMMMMMIQSDSIRIHTLKEPCWGTRFDHKKHVGGHTLNMQVTLT